MPPLNEVLLIDKQTGRRWKIRGPAPEAMLKRMLVMRMLAERLPIARKVKVWSGNSERP